MGVPYGCVVSFVLCCVGIFMNACDIQFLGLAGYLLGPEASSRSFSLMSMTTAIRKSGIAPPDFGLNFLGAFFIVFSGITVLVFLVALLVLRTVPMTVKQHRLLLVFSQGLNSVCGLEIFVLAVLGSGFELEPQVLYLLGVTKVSKNLNPILEKYMPEIPYIAAKVNGQYYVFDLDFRLQFGSIILLIACIISTAVGMTVLRKCSNVLLDVMHRPLHTNDAELRNSFESAQCH